MTDIIVSLRARDDKVFADSRDIAEKFEKQHKHVLESIRRLIGDAPTTQPNFRPFRIKDLAGDSTSHVEMTRDGFMLLVMGFTGKKALEWKVRYIEAFNKMEAELKQKRSTIRNDGKRVRNEFTTVLGKHGVTDYRRATNSIYTGLWDTDASGLRKRHNLPAKANCRDHMSSIALGSVLLSEALASEQIVVADRRGNDECSAIANRCALSVRKAVAEARKDQKLIN